MENGGWEGRIELSRTNSLDSKPPGTHPKPTFPKREANINRFTQIGYTYGGQATPTNNTCTATSTSFSKNLSNIYQ